MHAGMPLAPKAHDESFSDEIEYKVEFWLRMNGRTKSGLARADARYTPINDLSTQAPAVKKPVLAGSGRVTRTATKHQRVVSSVALSSR